MSTATATNVAEMGGRQLTLPRFEGFTVPRTNVTFAGSWESSLTSPEDVEIAKALKLGAEAKVTIEVEGCAPIVLGGRVQGRGHKLRKDSGSEAVVSTVRLVINDSRPGDDEGEDD